MTYWKITILHLITLITICSADKTIPRKMKQLYKQYRHRGLMEDDLNTIKCISPTKGYSSSLSKILFNLDSLDRLGETLAKAELHFYRRSVEEMKTVQIDISEVSPYYITLVQRLRLSPSGKGWQQIDITKAVKQCTNTINSYNKLGVGFSEVNEDAVAVPVSMPHFLKHHGLPFILLFSKNNRTLEMDQIANQTKLSTEQLMTELGAMINPETGKASKNARRLRRSVHDNKIETSLTDSSETPVVNGSQFNEVTKTAEPDLANSLPTTKKLEPGTFPLKKSARLSTKKRVYQIPKVQYLPWPKEESKKKKQKYTFSTSKSSHVSNTFESEKQKVCGRKPLRINFEDIGWGRRIIEPKKFDAYYCSGLCSFPYSYGKHLTNHATLQSLFTSIQKMTGVPQPCCVADKLQPVTLLFYDEYDNIVLKTYSDMIVESCACR